MLAIGPLECSVCGDEIDDTGYVPAAETAEGYDPVPEEAVCGACGYNDVGMMGCAPELEEVTDGPAAVLLFVRPTDEGVEVVSAKS